MDKKKIALLWAVLAAASYGETTVNLDRTIVKSVTGFETDMRKVAATPTVVTSKQIQEKNYKTVEEVLKDMPSISVSKDTFGSTIDLRGQGSTIAKRNVQILIDGVAVNSLDTSMTSTPINTIPVSSIERIEVIPGGGSVLYGSGTAGGVINIITKEGKGLRGNASYERASYDGNKYDMSVGQTFGKFDVDLLYSKTDADGYRNEAHDDTEFFQGKVKYNISDKQDIEFKYSNYDSEIFSPGSLTKAELDADRKQTGSEKVARITTKKDDYVVTYNAELTDNLEFNLVGFHQQTKMRIANKGEADYGFFDDKKVGLKPKFKYSYGEGNIAGSSVVFGLDYIDNDAQRLANMGGTASMGGQNYTVITTTTNDFTKKTLGGFVMNNLKYKKFEFNQGIRYEKSDYDIKRTSVTTMNGTPMGTPKSISASKDEDNFAFELSGSYLYSDTGKIYTRLEQGFTSPPPALLTDAIPSGSSTKYELNDLESETYRSIEFGWSDFIADNTAANVSVFYTLTDNEIYTNMSQMGKYAQKILNYNIDKTERYGAEISLEHYFGKLTLSESYQYIKAKIKDGTEKTYTNDGKRTDGADLSGRYIEGVPEHKFTLGAKYDFTERFNINGDIVYTGKSYIENTNVAGKADDYVVVNIRAGYTFDKGLQLYAGINNLFNEKYNDDINYSSGKLTYDPAAERNYYAGFRYTF